MDFDTFARRAHEAYQTIPEEFREGVDGLSIRPERVPHPTIPAVFTLGQCLTEGYPSDWSGPDTLRSVLVLFHGSFRALADDSPDFDWEGELWQTLTHELRHHLESLADEDALEGVDYALDETFKRDDGLDFDPWYYQHGDAMDGGVFRVEQNYYIEQAWTPDDFATAEAVELMWHGERYRLPKPEELGDVHFVWVHGIDTGPATLELVLYRRRGWWESAKRLVGAYRPVVLESEAMAEPVPGKG